VLSNWKRSSSLLLAGDHESYVPNKLLQATCEDARA
jgi:hypothetical protein